MEEDEIIELCLEEFTWGDVVVKEIMCQKLAGHGGWHYAEDLRGKVEWSR